MLNIILLITQSPHLAQCHSLVASTGKFVSWPLNIDHLMYCLSDRIDHIVKGLLVTGGLGVDNSTELWATDQVPVNSSWAKILVVKKHCGRISWLAKIIVAKTLGGQKA